MTRSVFAIRITAEAALDEIRNARQGVHSEESLEDTVEKRMRHTDQLCQ